MGKVIVVAPQSRATLVARSNSHFYAPVIDPRQTYLSASTTNFTNLVAQVPEQPTYHDVEYDPMISEIAWRLPFGMESKAWEIAKDQTIWMSVGTLMARFWEKQELIDWIEETLQGDVLVQPQMSGWAFCCVQLTDFVMLRQFLSETKRHNVVVRFETQDDLEIVKQWIKANVRGETETGFCLMPTAEQPGRYSILIREQSEAVHLRLRFSEIVREAKQDS